MLLRCGGLAALVLPGLLSRTAHGEIRVATAEPLPAETPTLTTETAPAPERTHRHAIYGELLGKGGAYGVGYDLQLRPWLGTGAVVSFSPNGGQRMYSVTPYVSIYPVGRGRHRWFVDAGPQLVHLVTPSPVPEWDGTSETGIAGELSSGYEYRGPVFVRAFGMLVGGKNGVAPWGGVSVGFTL